MEKFHDPCVVGRVGIIPRFMLRGRGSKGPFVKGFSGKILMPCVCGSKFMGQYVGIGLRLQDPCVGWKWVWDILIHKYLEGKLKIQDPCVGFGRFQKHVC